MEGNKARKLGGSLQVPNVQELAKDGLSELPLRYVVHPDMEPALVVTTTDFLLEVPVVDMARLESVELGAEELEKLRFACSEWGFFQVVEHDVSRSLIEEVKAEMGRFFGLPLEEKRRYAQEPGDLEGYGQAFVVSEDQRLDWADMFYVVTQPTSLRKPHLLPKLPAHFKDCVEAYSTELKRLALSILGSVSKAFKIDGEEMRELFDEGMQSMRSNYYPPCPQPQLAIGLTPHSDPTGLTILLQANDTEGLQVRKGGHWIPVKPLPNAFIVNIGDMLEIISNGACRSLEHRAVVNSEKVRLSVATFLSPNLQGDVGPARSLITPDTPPLFKTVSVEEYFTGVFAKKLDGKAYIESMRI